ncbi:unnamed protein product [Cladocopium goreaui]|uniref:BTB and MATH domain-containing protein 42 n=1 Tax=Cladocopium goreaui TaxID=2562237 RepID=A0A9P1DWG3_9DINO|nr:unnamed protein product [Cladocopium goreaui]
MKSKEKHLYLCLTIPTTDTEFNGIVTELREVFAAVHILPANERRKGNQDLKQKRTRKVEHVQNVGSSLVDRLLKLRGESGSVKSHRWRDPSPSKKLGLQRHVFGLNVPTVLRETLLVELTMVRFLAHDDDGAPSPVVDDEPEEEAEAVEVEAKKEERAGRSKIATLAARLCADQCLGLRSKTWNAGSEGQRREQQRGLITFSVCRSIVLKPLKKSVRHAMPRGGRPGLRRAWMLPSVCIIVELLARRPKLLGFGTVSNLDPFKSRAASSLSSLSPAERELERKLRSASEWEVVDAAVSSYTGNSSRIYVLAMNAAIHYDQLLQGASLYRKCKESCQQDSFCYSTALRIFGQLEDTERVCEVYQEALKDCGLNGHLAMSRISAAARVADVKTVAQVLDQMESRRVDIDLYHLTSAIRACSDFESKERHLVAEYFFTQIHELRLQPDTAVFSSMVATQWQAPLPVIDSLYIDMKNMQVEPDKLFAELYLTTVLQKPRGQIWDRNNKFLESVLQNKPLDRVKAAQNALLDFHDANVTLSRLCKDIDYVLRQRYKPPDSHDPYL